MATKIMNNCPICKQEVTRDYFAFPRLPESSDFSSIFGDTHRDCLLTHHKRLSIQEELTKIYLSYFHDNNDTPIVASDEFIVVKFEKHHEMLSIYDFEDFATFYMMMDQVNEVVTLKSGDNINLGRRGLMNLSSNNDNHLVLKRYFLDGHEEIITLSNLSIYRLRKLIDEALTGITTS
jgi:hypothetical protein